MREGEDPRVSEMFYRAVVQAVLLLGAETWVLLAAMSRKLEGVHIGFLRQVPDNKAKRQMDGTWRSVAAKRVLKEAVTQTLGTYIDKRQMTVAEWVALRPIIEICDRETGYKGGGRRCEPWWRKTAAWKELSTRLEEISAAERARRWEYGRRGKGGRDREVVESDAGSDGTRYAGTEAYDSQVGE